MGKKLGQIQNVERGGEIGEGGEDGGDQEENGEGLSTNRRFCRRVRGKKEEDWELKGKGGEPSDQWLSFQPGTRT